MDVHKSPKPGVPLPAKLGEEKKYNREREKESPKKPLTSEEWMATFKEYALYVSIAGSALAAVDILIQENVEEGLAKRTIRAVIASLSSALKKAYDVFKEGYDSAKNKEEPKFTNLLEFPQPPPVINGTSTLSFWQFGWNSVRDTLKVAAQSSEKMAKIMPVIEAGGERLVSELSTIFADYFKKVEEKEEDKTL